MLTHSMYIDRIWMVGFLGSNMDHDMNRRAGRLLIGNVLKRWAPLVSVLLVACGRESPLPYDRTSPVIYDNDSVVESGLTDFYVASLASGGVIDLRGVITTTSFGEEKRQPPYGPIPRDVLTAERQAFIDKARRSGMRRLPDVTPGPVNSLTSRRPSSGRIEDTPPLGSEGSWLIVNEARKASTTRPLVVVMGGQPTAPADAYLLDPTIADKMVLAWLAGNKKSDRSIDSQEFNSGTDPWATYIAFERLRVVAFPFSNDGNNQNDPAAHTPKSRLWELPDTELRQMLLESRWPRTPGKFSEPNEDLDGIPTISLTRPDYVRRTGTVSFDNWYPAPWNDQIRIPAFRADPRGRTLIAWDASAYVATEEWWAHVKNPAAWGPALGHSAMTGTPWAVPGTIEAENFDHGGTGRAYNDTTNNWTRAEWLNPIRLLEHVDILASPTASGGYKIGRTEAGEWIRYTINVVASGSYKVQFRVAAMGAGGSFRLELDGVDKTGPLTIPDSGGWDTWQLVSTPMMRLEAGVQVMGLIMTSSGASGVVGDFDDFRVTSEDAR